MAPQRSGVKGRMAITRRHCVDLEPGRRRGCYAEAASSVLQFEFIATARVDRRASAAAGARASTRGGGRLPWRVIYRRT
jgi:hypothetical protein